MAPRKPAPVAPNPPAAPQVARQPVRDVRAGIGHNSLGRTVATNRRGEPVTRSSATAGVNQFHVPPEIIPPGWSWEWKTETVAGMPDPAYAAELAQNGWEPVLAESFPGIFMPIDCKGAIRRKGMILMERPMELTLEAQRDEQMRAKERVGNAVRKHSLNAQGAHGVDVNNPAVQRNTYIRTSREVIDVPAPKYDRTID